MLDSYSDLLELLKDEINKQKNKIEIENYIMKYYPKVNRKDANEIANHLIDIGISVEDVKRGDIDKFISDCISFLVARKNSLEGKRVPLKTRKIRLAIGTIGTILTLYLAISGIAGYKNNENDKELSANLAQIIYNDSDRSSIVARNTQNVITQNGNAGVYSTIGIANDIMKICEKQPGLFDICLYNVYQNLKYNKLANMDAIMSNLLANGYTEYYMFLDYLLANGYDHENDEAKVAVDDYRSLVYTSKESYDSLSEADKKAIKALVDTYEKEGPSLESDKLVIDQNEGKGL